jgi:hypothetical protein
MQEALASCLCNIVGDRVADRSRTGGLAIVCAVTADHCFALASLIAGFRRHNAGFAGKFVIFHDGLGAEQQGQLRALWPDMVFHPYGPEVVSRRFGPAIDLGGVLARFSPMIFAKFEMPDLLAEYDKCLWLDVDMLVQGDLTDLWSFDVLAWRPLPQGAFARRAAVMAAFADLRGDAALPLLNGGVVGMGRGLPISTADLYAMAARLIADSNAASVDELALYFLAASRGVAVTLLDMRFNHPVVAPGGRDALLVHAIGPDKFWNAAPLQLAYPDWARNLRDWRGTGYDGPQRLADVQAATPDAALKAARNRAYWAQVYAALRPDLPRSLQVDLHSDGKTLRLFHSDAAYLCLTRQANERHIGIALHFDDDTTLAAALFGLLDGVTITDLPKAGPMELARRKQGWSYAVTAPFARCGQVINLLAAALDQATSRASN